MTSQFHSMSFIDKGVMDSKTHALDGKTRLQIALHIAQGKY